MLLILAFYPNMSALLQEADNAPHSSHLTMDAALTIGYPRQSPNQGS
jgi:hypothetical protein